MTFDHLLTKKKLEEEDSFEDFINPCSVRCFMLMVNCQAHTMSLFLQKRSSHQHEYATLKPA